MQVTKYVLPVVVGSMSGMILIVLGRMLVWQWYPLPPGTDKYDVESLSNAIRLLPDNAFRLLLITYVVCAFLAGIIATLIAQRTTIRPAIIVGIVLTLSALYDVINLSQPTWFSILNLLVYLPFALLGYRVVRKKAAVV